jgi:hypothetical protein
MTTKSQWLSSVFACLAATALTTVPAASQSAAPGPVVLELYTSQGCSSCPAADALLKSYVGRRDVIALSLPVDYWDYLGWKDTFANAKFTKRQRTYAKQRGDGQIYTPQIIINGRAHVVGSAKAELDSAIKATAEAATWAVKSTLANGTVAIEMPAAKTNGADMTVWLAVVQPEGQVEIRAGENRGRKLTYFNVVRDLVPAGMWSGAATTIKQQTANLTTQPGDRFVVLVQDGSSGAIVGAGWIEAPL